MIQSVSIHIYWMPRLRVTFIASFKVGSIASSGIASVHFAKFCCVKGLLSNCLPQQWESVVYLLRTDASYRDLDDPHRPDGLASSFGVLQDVGGCR